MQKEVDRFEEDLKGIIDVKLYKLIAYLEILREQIGSGNSTDDLNHYYQILGNARYEIKKLLGHNMVSTTYKVSGDEL
tara:strand:+ start:687 stop:920 length:234 start_codon:yes stop_codon:yes gene_type:complete